MPLCSFLSLYAYSVHLSLSDKSDLFHNHIPIDRMRPLVSVIYQTSLLLWIKGYLKVHGLHFKLSHVVEDSFYYDFYPFLPGHKKINALLSSHHPLPSPSSPLSWPPYCPF